MVARSFAALLLGSAVVVCPLGGLLAAEAAMVDVTVDLNQQQQFFTSHRTAPQAGAKSFLGTQSSTVTQGASPGVGTFATPGLPKKPQAEEPAKQEETPTEKKAEWIELDTNGNGKIDMVAIDLNGDGLFDIMRVDEDENGAFDYVLIDNDYNGVIDLTVFFVTNDKGETIGVWAIDANEDGKVDVYGVDDDLDGKVDRFVAA